MSNAVSEISGLNFDNIKWLTILRNKLCENGVLSDNDLTEAFNEIFSTDPYTTPANIPASIISSHTTRDSILYKLNKNTNVAGLLDNQELIFSPYFTLVFGKNGTGKSTYYKLLKDAFHSNQDIKSNIYSPNISIPINANISFTKKNAYLQHQKNGSIQNFDSMEVQNTWAPQTKIPSKIKFCDAQILSESLTKKSAGWDIDKFKLGYYDELREALEGVEEKVNEKIKELNKLITDDSLILTTNLKSEDEQSVKHTLLNGTHKIISELLGKIALTMLPDDFESQKEKHNTDSNIKVSDFTTQIESMKLKMAALTSERKKILNRLQLLNKIAACESEVKKHSELSNQRNNNAFDKYNLLFSVTGEVEKDTALVSLLKNIAETALKYGYKDYPANIDKCFYCNQDLSEGSKGLILELNKLVNSTLESEINQSAKRIKEHSKWIDENILNETIDSVLVFEKIGEIYDVSTKQQTNLPQLIQTCASQLNYESLKINLDTLNEDFSKIDTNTFNLQLFVDALNTELSILAYEQSEVKSKLDGIELIVKAAKSNLNKLIDAEFLFNNIVTLNKLKGNIDSHIKYSALSFQGYKTKISNDKSRVEKVLVRNNYDTVFNTYTQRFSLEKRDKIVRNFSISGGNTKIEPRITTDSGFVAITGILSEGEAKIYALCDWLTELHFENIDTLIFDDPISSLDHRNIEKVAVIITELCKKYQVVIFTHNHEFYDRLIKKSLGTKLVEKPSCEICSDSVGSDHCAGLHPTDGIIRKCGNYFKVEYTTHPGKTNRDIDFFRFNYDQRIADMKTRIIAGDDSDLKTDIRTTINSFFEIYILADIKRDVFRGEDLIHNWKKFRPIEETEYNTLMEIHNKLSGKSIHEPSIETNTELDILDYKGFLNELITVINKLRVANPIDIMP